MTFPFCNITRARRKRRIPRRLRQESHGGLPRRCRAHREFVSCPERSPRPFARGVFGTGRGTLGTRESIELSICRQLWKVADDAVYELIKSCHRRYLQN